MHGWETPLAVLPPSFRLETVEYQERRLDCQGEAYHWQQFEIRGSALQGLLAADQRPTGCCCYVLSHHLLPLDTLHINKVIGPTPGPKALVVEKYLSSRLPQKSQGGKEACKPENSSIAVTAIV